MNHVTKIFYLHTTVMLVMHPLAQNLADISQDIFLKLCIILLSLPS